MAIKVIFGTETGNAELVAEDISDALTNQGKQSEAIDIANFNSDALTTDNLYIFVCSTYGDGELPNSARPFLESLENDNPDLSHINFAIFGLGDSYYQTYNNASQLLSNKLLALNAQQIGKRGEHDATTGSVPGDIALAWIDQEIAPHL